jgi:hypothetical protein
MHGIVMPTFALAKMLMGVSVTKLCWNGNWNRIIPAVIELAPKSMIAYNSSNLELLCILPCLSSRP